MLIFFYSISVLLFFLIHRNQTYWTWTSLNSCLYSLLSVLVAYNTNNRLHCNATGLVFVCIRHNLLYINLCYNHITLKLKYFKLYNYTHFICDVVRTHNTWVWYENWSLPKLNIPTHISFQYFTDEKNHNTVQ